MGVFFMRIYFCQIAPNNLGEPAAERPSGESRGRFGASSIETFKIS